MKPSAAVATSGASPESSRRLPDFYKTAGQVFGTLGFMDSIPRRLPRILFAYLLAALAGYVVAILFATTANLLNLRAVGAEIGMGDALRTYLFDLWGMTPRFELGRYGTVMLVGFAIAFPVAALLRGLALRATPAVARIAPYLYPLAGATAIGTGLAIMYMKYELTAVAGARGAGFWAQCLAGALAGFVFQRLLPRRGS